jgi:predicted GNAT family N-acyltransferase
MSRELEIRNFDIREADWKTDSELLTEIRRIVFIVEQQVPREEELDGRDEDSWHWLATDAGGAPIGTARLLPEGQVGRMAVLPEHRGSGVGAALLECAVEKARHLGFESVFLHAQTHALEFYRKAGFEPEGEEFMDAGIPHYLMTRALAPLQDEARRIPAAGPPPSVSIRKFDAAEVDWAGHGKIIRKIREAVLVRELGLDESMITDDEDEQAIHWQAQAPDEQVVGAIRMNLEGTVSRLAVLENFRSQGVGHALLELAVAKAKRFGYPEVNLMALTELDSFYRQAGFEPRGEILEVQGYTHQEYYKTLEYEDVFERSRIALTGDDYEFGDLLYRLGVDNKLILLRKEEEFRSIITEMCKQATQSIRIYSPVLEHKLFDNEELMEICSTLARRNKYTRIEILIFDSHRMIKNGHALLDISRKLSSSISIRIVDPELRGANHEYVLVDDHGIIFRHDYELFDGYANFSDLPECNRLGRAFRSAWESSLTDAYLRQLKI